MVTSCHLSVITSENLWVRKWFTSSFTKSYCNYSKLCNVVDSNLLNAVFLSVSWRNRACWVEGNFELLWCGVMERCPYIIGFLTLFTSLGGIQWCHKWGHLNLQASKNTCCSTNTWPNQNVWNILIRPAISFFLVLAGSVSSVCASHQIISVITFCIAVYYCDHNWL